MGTTACGNEQVCAFDDFMSGGNDANSGTGFFDAFDLDAATNGDAFGLQRVENHLGEFGVVLGKWYKGFQHRDFGSEPAMGQRHFHADGPATYDNEMFWQFTVF